MTTKPHPFHIHIPPELWERFQKIAETNRRKLKEEALIAIENHVTASEGGRPKKKKPTK